MSKPFAIGDIVETIKGAAFITDERLRELEQFVAPRAVMRNPNYREWQDILAALDQLLTLRALSSQEASK